MRYMTLEEIRLLLREVPVSGGGVPDWAWKDWFASHFDLVKRRLAENGIDGEFVFSVSEQRPEKIAEEDSHE